MATRADRRGLAAPADQEDAALETLLYPRPKLGVEVHPTPDVEWIKRNLGRKHVGINLLVLVDWLDRETLSSGLAVVAAIWRLKAREHQWTALNGFTRSIGF
jgi:hypothetical protein